MKKNYPHILLLFMLMGFLLSGCDSKQADSSFGIDGSNNWLLSVEPEYVNEWPENDFTSCILKPEHGDIDYVCDYSDNGRYEVVIKNISQSESAAYVKQLMEQGYSEISSESNKVSTGTTLEKEGVVLSIAYSDGVLNILITMGDAAS